MRRTFFYMGVFSAAGFCLGRGAEVMWPEASALQWWTAAAVLFSIGLAGPALYDRWLVPWKQGSGNVPFWITRFMPWSIGMIPLRDGAELVWKKCREQIRALVGTEYEDRGVHKMVYQMMFDGRDDAVPLFAAKPPFKTLEIVEDAHEYNINEECTEAIYSWGDKKKITNLKVRRGDLERWIRRFNSK